MTRPYIGATGHYVADNTDDYGDHFPATITHVYPDGVVSLVFFTGEGTGTPIRKATHVHFSETKEPGTWHFIEALTVTARDVSEKMLERLG